MGLPDALIDYDKLQQIGCTLIDRAHSAGDELLDRLAKILDDRGVSQSNIQSLVKGAVQDISALEDKTQADLQRIIDSLNGWETPLKIGGQEVASLELVKPRGPTP